MKAVIRAELGEKCAFGEKFRRGGRDEHFLRVQGVNYFSGVQRVKLNAKICVPKFRALGDALDALGQAWTLIEPVLCDRLHEYKQKRPQHCGR